MTARKQQMLEIMQHCLLDDEFCDTCPNVNEGYEGCRALHEEFIREVRRSWEAEGNDHGEETNGDPDHHGAQCQGAAQH